MEMHRANEKVDPFEMPTEEQNMNEREEQISKSSKAL